MNTEIVELLSITLILMAGICVHMTPTLLAHQKSHPQKSLITLVNLIPGVGWFAGLALLTSSSLQLHRVMAEAPAKRR